MSGPPEESFHVYTLSDQSENAAQSSDGRGTVPPEVKIDTKITGDAEVSRAPASSSGSLPALKNLGHYEIRRELGRGGMGAVYLAKDTVRRRKVALKIPQFEPQNAEQMQSRFWREAKLASGLRHPNICRVHDVGIIDGHLVMVMEYVKGLTLSSFTKPGKLLSQRQAVKLVKKVALAMEEAHRNGLIHRDLKPGNIMLPKPGPIRNEMEPKVMDFGLAKQLGSTEPQLTRSGMIIGTPCYMSKEQWSGKDGQLSPASDVYSLGVILYELLSGKLPYESDPGEPPTSWFVKLLTQQQIPVGNHLSNFDFALSAIVMRAIEKEPGDRYATMREFADDLDAWLQGNAVKAGQSLSGFDFDFSQMEPAPALPRRRPKRSKSTPKKEKPKPDGRSAESRQPPCTAKSWLLFGLTVALGLLIVLVAMLQIFPGQITPTEHGQAAPSTTGIAKTSLSLRQEDVNGFPQRDATVLMDGDELRVSVCSNDKYLFVQAIMWNDQSDLLGKTADGRDVGDFSKLDLDLDNDQKATPLIDRVYYLNPWPQMIGLYYQVKLENGHSTFLQPDSSGRGSIGYFEDSSGSRVRVDSFLIPLAEINRKTGDVIGLAYSGSSYVPNLSASSGYFKVNLASFSGRLNGDSIPDPRKYPALNSEPPEIVAGGWLNTDGPQSLATLRGHVVLVDFWATWCQRSVDCIRRLNELQEKYEDEGLRILGITVEDRQIVEAFQKTTKTPMQFAIGVESQLGEEYGINDTPHAFLIGRDGKLLWHGDPNSAYLASKIAEAIRLVQD